MKVGKQGETHQIVWIWLVLGITLMAVLTWFNGRPEVVGLVYVPWDKVTHGLIFGGSLTFGLSVGGRRRWLMLLFRAAFAAFDELRQMLLPGRTASMGDFAIGMLAIIATLCVVLPWLLHVWGRRV